MLNVQEQEMRRAPLLYRRTDAERVLNGTDVRPFQISPDVMPIAGLRSILKEPSFNLDNTPQEVHPDILRPWIILDCDDSIWGHAGEELREALNGAIGTHVSVEAFRAVGNSRKIPEWMTSEAAVIHDQIVKGVHPQYFPFVNSAYSDAVAVVRAIERMGFGYAYLTARMDSVFDATKRVLQWNNLPVSPDQLGFVNALDHNCPGQGFLYCSQEIPMIEGRRVNFKEEVVGKWVDNFKKANHTGPVIVVDDLQDPFVRLLENGQVIGLQPPSDVNMARPPIPGAAIMGWNDIGQFMMEMHKEAVRSNPSPIRTFVHNGRTLWVHKNAAGCGEFRLDQLPKNAYGWFDDEASFAIQEQFKQLGDH